MLDRTAAAIVGKVTDGQGQPLPGLEVVATDSEGSIVGSGITSEDGTYIVDGLSAGSYTVEFEPGADDYLPQYYSAQDSVTTATPVSLASDAVASHVDAVMQAGATIGGVVTTTEGAPLDDVDVSVYGEGGGFLQAVTTDEDGTYSVSGLPEGSYTVGFEPVSSNYVGQFYDEKAESASATSIVLAAGANKMGVDARLAEGATVKGTVTAEDGSPLENVEVHIQSASGGIGGSAVTDSDGSYSIAGLRPGSYTIQFAPTDGSYAGQYYDNEPEAGEADAVALSAGVTEGIDATLSPGATVSGTVTDEQTHAPVDGVQVSIEPAEGGGESVTTTTGEDGTYSVSDLPPGRYTVAFEPDEAHYVGQYYDEQSGGASASQITLAAGADAEDIDAALVESATITGKVTSAKTGLPVAAATVFVQSAEGDVARTATTGEDGSYSVSGLPTGSYSIEFSAEGQDYLSQFYEDQSEIGSAQAVAVSPGETKAGIDAALADGATVAGTVTDAQSGEPVSGVEVYVRAIEGGFDGVGTTEADGSYSVTGLLPGKYTVQFSPSESNDLGQYYDEKGSIGEADPVTLVAGETKAGVNASLASGAAVSGTVTAAQSGEPLGGIEVDAYTSACDGSGGYALTDAQGAYVIRGLPEGSYHVVFNPGGGSYEAELYSRTISLAKNSNENGTDGALVATSTESPAATLGCIGALVPANLFPPAIDGSAIEGQALTESHGSWSGDPTSFGYQWERCDSSGGACQAMAGATSQVYVLARADVGSTIRVLETAGNAEGSGAPASSAPTAIVQALPVGAEVPRIVVPSSPSSTSSGKASGPPSKRKCSKGKRRKRGKCIKKKHHRKHKKA